MFTYLAHFWGRSAGAIGVCHKCAATVSAPDVEAALLRLYDTHEHIHYVRWTITHIDGKPVDKCT